MLHGGCQWLGSTYGVSAIVETRDVSLMLNRTKQSVSCEVSLWHVVTWKLAVQAVIVHMHPADYQADVLLCATTMHRGSYPPHRMCGCFTRRAHAMAFMPAIRSIGNRGSKSSTS